MVASPLRFCRGGLFAFPGLLIRNIWGSLGVDRSAQNSPSPHSRHTTLWPGQLSRWVPPGQQWPFELIHLAQTKILRAPRQSGHSIGRVSRFSLSEARHSLSRLWPIWKPPGRNTATPSISEKPELEFNHISHERGDGGISLWPVRCADSLHDGSLPLLSAPRFARQFSRSDLHGRFRFSGATLKGAWLKT